MANYKINLNQINKKVAKSKSFQKKISKKIDTLVQKEKQKLIAEFNAHPVTKEIEAGPTASNSSGTLGGYGNLFSFIGFRSGSQPVAPLRELISTVVKTNQIAKKIKVKEKGVELTQYTTLSKSSTNRTFLFDTTFISIYSSNPWDDINPKPNTYTAIISQHISGIGGPRAFQEYGYCVSK